MRYKEDFSKSLNFGQIGEEMMSNYFVGKINENCNGYKYHITEYSRVKDWDFKALAYNTDSDGKSSIFPNEGVPKLLVEVKTDRYAKRTGNIFIELKSRGKKSGIMTTESNWFIYFFIRKNIHPRNNVFIFKTENLREIVNIESKDQSKLTYGGDNNTSLGCLLNIDYLMEKYSDKFLLDTYSNYDLVFNDDLDVIGWNLIKEKKIGFQF